MLYQREIEINENPEKGTAGLTSASQIVNVTDAISFESSNSSSAFSEYIVPIPIEETEIEKIEPFHNKKYRFKEGLKRSVRKNIDILEELAKY